MFPCSQAAARGGGGNSRRVEERWVGWGELDLWAGKHLCQCIDNSRPAAPTPTSAQQELRLPLLQSKDQLAARRVSVVPGQEGRGRTLLTVDYWLSAGSKLWRLSAFTRMHYWALTSFHAVNLRHLILLAPLPLPLAVAVADAVDFWYYDVLAEGLNELTAHRGHCRIALTTLTLPPRHLPLCSTKLIAAQNKFGFEGFAY